MPQFDRSSPTIRFYLINYKNSKNERQSEIRNISLVYPRRREQMSARVWAVSMSYAAALFVLARGEMAGAGALAQ